jgi:gliding motility-associated lipoprotein GldH
MVRVAFFLTFLSIVACKDPVLVEKQFDIKPDAGWSYDEVLTFPFEIKDTARQYALMLDIRHKPDYAYQNLYLQLTTIFPNADTSMNPLSIELADKTGQWYGSCSGRACDVTIPLQESIRFQAKGKYEISIEQYMRVNPVMGLERLTLKLLKE